jgi:hypothetical protein
MTQALYAHMNKKKSSDANSMPGPVVVAGNTVENKTDKIPSSKIL